MNDANVVKPDYKHTPLGMIPTEWNVVKLKEVAKVQGGYAFDSRKFTSSGNYQVVKMSNVYNDKLDLNRSTSFLTTLTLQERNFLLEKDNILLTLTGTIGKRDYGFSFRINEEKNLLLNQRVARIIAKHSYSDPAYLSYELKTNRFLDQFFISARGGTGNQANVGTGDVEIILIVVPPLYEQIKVAGILNEWDSAISRTRQLIAQVKQRNKGLMQQLLTGQRRLSKFDQADWKRVELGEIFERLQTKNLAMVHEIDILTISGKSGFLSQQEKFNRVIAGNSLKNYTLLRQGDFSYNKGNSKTYQYGCVFKLDDYEKALVPNVYISFRSKGTINNDFYSYYFKQDLLKKALAKIISSGARMDGLLNVSSDDFFKIKVPCPPLLEQQKIAEILTNADAELKVYENKLLTIQQQKKGLMQKLLTGKIRVKIN